MKAENKTVDAEVVEQEPSKIDVDLQEKLDHMVDQLRYMIHEDILKIFQTRSKPHILILRSQLQDYITAIDEAKEVTEAALEEELAKEEAKVKEIAEAKALDEKANKVATEEME